MAAGFCDLFPGEQDRSSDGKRIAELLAHGQLPESFIPPRWQRELRDLTRLRARFAEETTRTSNRIQKVLEDAQIKLGDVGRDVLGVFGRLMLKAIIAGETDAAGLAAMARGKPKRGRSN